MPQPQPKSGLGSYVAVAVVALLVGRCSVSPSEPSATALDPSTAAEAAPQALIAPADPLEADVAPAPLLVGAADDDADADADAEVYYRNCSAARAAGAAPLHVGEPGYDSHLDRDDDGIACE